MNSNDFKASDLDYIFLSFFSNKLKVKIVGGGFGAAIKAKTFITKGCTVEVLAKEFCDDILELRKYGLKCTIGEYTLDFLKNAHIVLIVVPDKDLREKIIGDCEDMSKIYIDCSEFKNGMAVVPSQTNLNNLSFSLTTKVGAPVLSKMLNSKIKQLLSEYDDFTYFVGKLREEFKKYDNKKEIISFICSDDFKYFYDKGKANIVLDLFFEK